MKPEQRRVIVIAAYAVAAILFVACFLQPFWAWATWDSKQGTLDLGVVKLTNRPPFPSGAKGIGLGLVVPIALAAIARVMGLASPSRGGSEP